MKCLGIFLVMLGLGGLVGLLACWLDGCSFGRPYRLDDVGPEAVVHLFPRNVAVEASYFSYYALAFFALRWWRMTSRRRSQRFSFAPILGAGFWAAVLLLLVRPAHQSGPVTAAVVLLNLPPSRAEFQEYRAAEIAQAGRPCVNTLSCATVETTNDHSSEIRINYSLGALSE